MGTDEAVVVDGGVLVVEAGELVVEGCVFVVVDGVVDFEESVDVFGRRKTKSKTIQNMKWRSNRIILAENNVKFK